MHRLYISVALLLGMIVAAGCDSIQGNGAPELAEGQTEGAVLVLPPLTAVPLTAGEKLRVVATTSIIGDVVAQVGGDAIELTTLMRPGQDPHGYEPAAADLTAVADADVIFINGWDLEEGLINRLANIAGDTPLVPVSAGIEPLAAGEVADQDDDHVDDEDQSGDDHDHLIDPHTWFNVANVGLWADNISQVLSTLDPDRSVNYQADAAAYKSELALLDQYIREQTATIPPERRQLVTNHDSLSHFALTYGFEIIGTVLPGASTLAEPSAAGLAQVVDLMDAAGVCTLFAETTANRQLAEAVGTELRHCEKVQVLSLHTDALGPANSGAEEYIGLMKTNIDVIVSGLKE